jgi:DNA-binding response OmpR family regulator
MRVLVIEDDRELAEAIGVGLPREQMAVDIAADGDCGLERALAYSYDVIVLDRDLPRMHGDEVCAHLVREECRSRVLMLTAAATIEDTVDGLGLGADDYMPKPFAFAELVARIRALFRRAQPALAPVLERGDLLLDPARRSATRRGQPLDLGPKEFGVLELLLAAQSRVVSAEELLERVWDEMADPFTSSVKVTVSRLRRKLKELGDTFDGLLGRLEAAFGAQRQFVANASHELRTPLARQRTVAEVALADPQPTVASLQGACQRMLAAGQQQERLIEALLTLARSERGLDRQERLDLAEVVRAAVAARHGEASSRGVELKTDLAAAAALGDSRLAERLIANLVDNAVRHNVPDGTAWVSTRTDAGHAVVSVNNTGPQVPPDQVDRLFQPFQRLRAERAAAPRDGAGLGLGLPIVAAIATAHGAWVRAWPQPSGGLSIAVRFPPVPGHSAAGQAQWAVPDRPLNGWPHLGEPEAVDAHQHLVRAP